MKKTNKKGFTIVELVIVIAVIAILAAVMIPTFGGMIDKANESNAKSAAKNAHTSMFYSIGDVKDDVEGNTEAYIVVDGKYYFPIVDGEYDPESITETKPADFDTAWEASTEVEDLGEGVVVYLPKADAPAQGGGEG